MKPSKIRNRTLHHPSRSLRSKLMSGHLSKNLRNTYHTRSVRIVAGDSVTITRGGYREVTGRVDKVDPSRGIVISGIKEEKTAGEKFDIYIHPSNILITSLNLDDKRRSAKLKSHKPQKDRPLKSEPDESQSKFSAIDESDKPDEIDDSLDKSEITDESDKSQRPERMK